MDKYGFVLTGHDFTHDAHGSHKPLPFESSVPGVFAAGDARHGSTKQVASAVGEGAAQRDRDQGIPEEGGMTFLGTDCARFFGGSMCFTP